LAEPLLRHGDFMKLWVGETISVFGSQFSPIAIQVAAKNILHAEPIQFGILASLATLPFLVFGLPVGVWADRYRRKRIMIYADIGRALILVSIPLAWLASGLSMEVFYVVAFATGVLTVFFEICYQSYLPTLVERSQLMDANSKLQTSQATAGGIGPSLAGAVITFVSAPLAIFGDVVGYFFSAGFLSWIRKQESVIPKTGGSAWRDVREGLSVVFGDVRLRSIAGCTGMSNLFSATYGAILIPYMIQDFGFDPFRLGLVLSSAAIGGITGAVSSQRIPKRIGVGRTIVVFAALFCVAPIGMYFATADTAPLMIGGSLAVSSFAGIVYNVSQVSYRQALVGLNLQGRLNATMRTIVWGTLPVGGILGGILAQAFGYHAAIGAAVAVGAFSFLWVLFSPVRGIKDIPTSPERA